MATQVSLNRQSFCGHSPLHQLVTLYRVIKHYISWILSYLWILCPLQVPTFPHETEPEKNDESEKWQWHNQCGRRIGVRWEGGGVIPLVPTKEKEKYIHTDLHVHIKVLWKDHLAKLRVTFNPSWEVEPSLPYPFPQSSSKWMGGLLAIYTR